jgi:hypothetical protein
MLSRFKGWFAALSLLGKIGVVAVGSLVGLSTLGAVVGPPSEQAGNQDKMIVDSPPQVKPLQQTCDATKTTTTETQPVPFDKTTVNDPSTAKGKTYIKTNGVDGVRTLTYEVITYTPTGCQADTKTLASDEVTTQPISEVDATGTYVASTPLCDPNYAGGCVPIASDVDCGGGSGDGPAYFWGTARVVGYDIYGLDRDGDGLACE